MITCVCCPPGVRHYRGFYEVLMRSFSIAIDCRQDADVERLARDACIHFVRPKLERNIGLLDFRFTSEPVDAGHVAALDYLKGPAQAMRNGANRRAGGQRRASGDGLPVAGEFTADSRSA